jgi:hypothetical protein
MGRVLPKTWECQDDRWCLPDYQPKCGWSWMSQRNQKEHIIEAQIITI